MKNTHGEWKNIKADDIIYIYFGIDEIMMILQLHEGQNRQISDSLPSKYMEKYRREDLSSVTTVKALEQLLPPELFKPHPYRELHRLIEGAQEVKLSDEHEGFRKNVLSDSFDLLTDIFNYYRQYDSRDHEKEVAFSNSLKSPNRRPIKNALKGKKISVASTQQHSIEEKLKNKPERSLPIIEKTNLLLGTKYIPAKTQKLHHGLEISWATFSNNTRQEYESVSQLRPLYSNKRINPSLEKFLGNSGELYSIVQIALPDPKDPKIIHVLKYMVGDSQIEGNYNQLLEQFNSLLNPPHKDNLNTMDLLVKSTPPAVWEGLVPNHAKLANFSIEYSKLTTQQYQYLNQPEHRNLQSPQLSTEQARFFNSLSPDKEENLSWNSFKKRGKRLFGPEDNIKLLYSQYRTQKDLKQIEQNTIYRLEARPEVYTLLNNKNLPTLFYQYQLEEIAAGFDGDAQKMLKRFFDLLLTEQNI